MKLRAQIIKSLSRASGNKSPKLEFSSRPEFGDYATNVVLQSKNPGEKAEEILDKLNKDKSLRQIVQKIEIAGTGFINFHLNTKTLLSNLSQIVEEKEKYGYSTKGNGKVVVVDYSAPNIAKPFGIGHLRSTIIGQAFYNLYKALGYKVIGDNHLGDWGTQFGKLIYMINKKQIDLNELTIQKLEELYVEFHRDAKENPDLEEKAREWFKKLEDGDRYSKKVWKACIETSIKEFNRIYKLLGVKIDYTLGESFYEGEMKKMLADPEISKHFKLGENGAKVIDLGEFGIEVPLMFIKSDGATTYAARDLATIKYRVERWNPHIIIYEVSVEQELHFRQVFAAAKILGLVKDAVVLYHTRHGWYLGSDGKKFSTRLGKTVKLEDVLNEAIERAKRFNKDESVAKAVGLGAIKYYDLMRDVKTNVVFDWDKIFLLEGNSGPYLQYTVARINSVLEKAPHYKLQILDNFESEELLILRQLIKFSEIIQMAAETYSPNLLCEYLYNLASLYNTFYNKHKIIMGLDKRSLSLRDQKIQDFRLALTFGVGQVLRNGLTLLGIDTPERM